MYNKSFVESIFRNEPSHIFPIFYTGWRYNNIVIKYHRASADIHWHQYTYIYYTIQTSHTLTHYPIKFAIHSFTRIYRVDNTIRKHYQIFVSTTNSSHVPRETHSPMTRSSIFRTHRTEPSPGSLCYIVIPGDPVTILSIHITDADHLLRTIRFVHSLTWSFLLDSARTRVVRTRYTGWPYSSKHGLKTRLLSDRIAKQSGPRTTIDDDV